MRFLFYSHDGFGLGHTCRNLAIARCLTELAPRAAVLLATGSDDVTRLGVPDRVEILKLPSIRKLGNERYGSRHLSLPGGDVRRMRAHLLASTVNAYRPDVLLVDKHPFGAGGELRPALGALRRRGGRAALGLRDILDEPETVRAEWAPHHLPEAISDHYDAVLVYGQREVFDAAGAYGFPEPLARRTHYCGYVCHPEVEDPDPEPAHAYRPGPSGERPFVIATVGGGEDGLALLESFLHGCTAAPWRVAAITGPMMPGAHQSHLEQVAHTAGLDLHRFVPRLHRWYQGADAVVCMGGYNTISQTLSAGTRVLCVPRVHPRREQFVRAHALADRGLLRLLHPDGLNPARLRREIETSLSVPRDELQQRIRSTMEFDGAETAAHRLLALARTSQGRPGHLQNQCSLIQ